MRLYDDILNQLCDDVKDVPISVIDSQQFLYDVIKGLQNARVRRDEESTNSFIQQLVIKFFIACDRSQIESKFLDSSRLVTQVHFLKKFSDESYDAKQSWEVMTRILAHKLVSLQPNFDKLVQPNWFAGRVLYSLQVKNSAAVLLDPQLLDARFAEAIKHLIFNNLINAQEYDKALVISMRGIT